MTDKIIQKDNTVGNGDIIGRDKISIAINSLTVKKDTDSKPISPTRQELTFDPECDPDSTALSSKLKDGKTNRSFQIQAKRSKSNTLKLLLDICQSETGKGFIADVYENLISSISANFISTMDGDDLLKDRADELFASLKEIATKYNGIVPIDEAFLWGLLFIATSNCAIRWKIEGEEL
jgi:hypothetical protein